LQKNANKKVKQLSDDQFIEVFEQSVEFLTLNDRLSKKIIIRDLIRKKIAGLNISEMFECAEWEVDDKLPKLTNVMAELFCKAKFLKALTDFNASQAHSKVQYTVLNLMTSMIKFTDKVMKMKKNGYKGYKYTVEQVDASGVSLSQAANEEEKIPVLLQFDIDHLDWESIKTDETEETFLKYSRGLGLYIMLTNKESEMTQIFKLDLEKSMTDPALGKI